MMKGQLPSIIIHRFLQNALHQFLKCSQRKKRCLLSHRRAISNPLKDAKLILRQKTESRIAPGKLFAPRLKLHSNKVYFESDCMIPSDIFFQLIKLFVNRGRQLLPLIPMLMRYLTVLAFHYPILTRNRDSEIPWRVFVPL